MRIMLSVLLVALFSFPAKAGNVELQFSFSQVEAKSSLNRFYNTFWIQNLDEEEFLKCEKSCTTEDFADLAQKYPAGNKYETIDQYYSSFSRALGMMPEDAYNLHLMAKDFDPAQKNIFETAVGALEFQCRKAEEFVNKGTCIFSGTINEKPVRGRIGMGAEESPQTLDWVLLEFLVPASQKDRKDYFQLGYKIKSY